MRAFIHADNIFIRFCYFCIRKFVGPIIRFIWIKNVVGVDRIPKEGPAVIAFNHQSYFDFICFIAVSPRNVHYLSAEKFFSHPLWRIPMLATGQIRVERHRKDKRELHETVLEHLQSGKVIGIFPEGTRSPHINEMLVAFTGVAKYAVKGNVPVIPVGIKGAYEIMSRNQKVPHFMKSVEIIIGTPISFAHFNHVKLNQRAYRVLTNQVMFRIAELSGKSYRHANRYK